MVTGKIHTKQALSMAGQCDTINVSLLLARRRHEPSVMSCLYIILILKQCVFAMTNNNTHQLHRYVRRFSDVHDTYVFGFS